MPHATSASSSAASMEMVRVMLEPSLPSARMNLPFFRSAPQSSSNTLSGTPVYSQQDNMPCVYCTVGTAELPHSMHVLAPHSMKWLVDTEGRRISTSLV